MNTTQPYENTRYVIGRVNDEIQEYLLDCDNPPIRRWVYNVIHARWFGTRKAAEEHIKEEKISGQVAEVKIVTQITKIL